MSSRLLVVTVLLFVAPSFASAHGIGVEAKLKGDRVAVEAFFDDDTPVADAKVAVTAEDGKTVAEGKADAKGTWSFPARRQVQGHGGRGWRASGEDDDHHPDPTSGGAKPDNL